MTGSLMTGSLLRSREAALALVIAVLVALIGIRAPVFLAPATILATLTDTSFLFMLVLAQMVVLLTRGIDLSVAANLAFSGMIAAMVSRDHPEVPILAILALSTVCGLGLGIVNGVLVALVGIPPIVVTLGTLAVFRGMIFFISEGKWVTPIDMSEAFMAFPKATFLGLPSLLWIALLVIAAMWLFLNRTRTGRALYAVGGNPVAARYCGIDIARLQLLVYAISGAVSGLCGYLWASRYGVAYAELALGYEFTVIAACVIGGVSIAGGIGSVSGAVLGALFLGVIVNALPVVNVSPFWQTAISGAVILAAVVVNARSEKSAGKIILAEAKRAANRGALP